MAWGYRTPDDHELRSFRCGQQCEPRTPASERVGHAWDVAKSNPVLAEIVTNVVAPESHQAMVPVRGASAGFLSNLPRSVSGVLIAPAVY